MVVKELENRSLKLGFQRKDIYVTELLKFVKKGGSRDERLLDLLLLSAVIEARSCERFRLLSLELKEQNLRDFYHQFVISEAGHYRLFLNLAELYLGKEKTWKRWQEFLDYEAQVMADIGLRAGSMH
jgi:tRNA-(ms[2]io[6]A)-hydroxylase